MPITDFDQRREELILNIRQEITEEDELKALLAQFSRLMVKKEARIRRAQKKLSKPNYTRIPIIESINSNDNVVHSEAIEDLRNTIEEWK